MFGNTLRGIVFSLLIATAPVHATSFTLDDIDFWVGEGENEIGIAIDWNGDDLPLGVAAPSLAWGFRWDGDATAEDALRAVLAADPRLFGRLSGTPGLGVSVLGLGYDANDDGEFAIEPDPLFEEVFMLEITETFDAATGIADSSSLSFAGPSDPADAYDEGFESNFVNPSNSGFWHIATATGGIAEDWLSSPVGVSGITLTQGLFVGLSFTPTFDFTAFPNNLVAAEPPGTATPGDFTGDGLVDTADFVALRDTGGDAPAFAQFAEQFGADVKTTASAVPEPTTLTLVLAFAAFVAADRPRTC